MPRGRSKGVKSVSKSRQPRTEKGVRLSTSTQHDDQGFRKRQSKNRGDNSRRRFQRRRYNQNAPDKSNRNAIPQMPSAPTPARFPGSDIPNPLETPAAPGGNANGVTPDKLQAEGLHGDLDFYGTNDGLVLFNGNDNETQENMASHSLSLSVGSDGKQCNPDVSELTKEKGDLKQTVMTRLRKMLREQEEYIAELEDQNMKLKEEIDLLTQPKK